MNHEFSALNIFKTIHLKMGQGKKEKGLQLPVQIIFTTLLLEALLEKRILDLVRSNTHKGIVKIL